MESFVQGLNGSIIIFLTFIGDLKSEYRFSMSQLLCNVLSILFKRVAVISVYIAQRVVLHKLLE